MPALIVAPDAHYAGRVIPRLCSQVDLAPTVLELASLAATLGFSARTAACRQTLRIRSVAASVSSVRQRLPSHTSQRPQVATYRQSRW